MIERRTDLIRIANMTDQDESAMKSICKKFASSVNYNMEWEYYSVTFTPENWMLAVLADPNIERYLNATP